jgi:hypothetical protein
MLPLWNRGNNNPSAPSHQNQSPTIDPPSPSNSSSSVNIEDLINQLDSGNTQESTEEPEQLPENPVQKNQHIEELIDQLDIGILDQEINQPSSAVSPGVLQTGDHVIIDIDDIVPPVFDQHQPVDVDELTNNSSFERGSDAAYIYVPESDSWIAVSTDPMKRTTSKNENTTGEKKEKPKVLERIIEIPWDKLRSGDSSYNIVIRPEDRIYVKPPPLGNLYIRGEITRPGVFNYPNSGEKITLSEFIISAGDLGPIAVPERVSLTRRIGNNMQATVTLNYAAILQRTEPDIFLKPNDTISIGTSWGATPMAIIRNGFRATYGFGFLLDRNFGNDVFGSPP